MAAAVELATGYVTLTVETSQVAKAIGRAFGDGEKFAAVSGQKMGKAISQGLQKAQAPALDDLKAKLKDAEGAFEKASEKVKDNQAKLSAAMDKSARDQTNALNQVRIAEQKLEELRQKGGDLAQVRIAEQKLKELRDSGKASASQLMAAEERVKKARESGKASASQLMAAEEKVTRARQKHADVSQAGEAKVLAFRQALESSERSLKEAGQAAEKASSDVKKLESSLEQGEDSVKRFGGAFGGLRQKIASSFKGAFDGPKKDAKEAGDYMEREFRDAGQKSGGGFKESFKGAFAGFAAYVGVQEIVGGIKSAVMGAGDLEQSVGAVDSIFKGSAGQIHNWARTASTSVGISTNSYNEFASLIGAQLKNAGTPMEELGEKTNSLIMLGADLASMFGGTTAEAVDALSSALKGEMDPIERYGISLNDAALTAKGLEMGITKTGGAFTDQEKKLITQALLFQQSADAQGNFAREADTFQGKLQRAGAQWEDLSAKIGELFLPALSDVMGFVGQHGLPVLSEFVGGIRAFREAWIEADGDITSSGFPGYMEELAFKIRGVYDWLVSTSGTWGPFAAGIAIVTGAYWGWVAATTTLAAVKGALAAAIAAVNWPITLVIAGLGLLVGGLIHAYNNVGWFRDLVDIAWARIKEAIGAVVTWWQTTAWPGIETGLKALGGWFSWLWQTIVVPAFQGIVKVISWAWETIIMPLFKAVSWYVQNFLGPVFSWLWNNIIIPVWNGISLAIQVAWRIIQAIFGFMEGHIKLVLAPAFRWFWEKVISPVWTWISDKIQTVSGFITETIFPKLEFGLKVLKTAFEKTKEGIGKAWNTLKALVAEPIKFVVNTVINDGLIKGYNNLNDFWGGQNLDRIELPPGFATGGWTGPGAKYDVAGVVHADEYVINKASRRRFEKENPGLLDHINRTGTLEGAAAGGHSHGPGTYCAHCAGQAAGHSTTASTAGAPPSGSSGIWGAFQQQVARAGKLFVPKMNFMGVNTENVAKAWMGRSAVEIIAGNGSPGISFHTGGAGTWGFNSGSNIWMQPSVPGAMREAVLIHELGHALSLHHTMNTGSIMHPLVAGPKWPSALDYGALVKAWGAPGEGVKTYEGGGGVFSMLVDKAKELITDKVKDLADGARKHFHPNQWVDMPIGIAEKSVISLVEKAAEFFGGSSSDDSGGGGVERWRGTVKEALGRAGLPGTDAYVNAWLKQIQTESGGNPNAIQQVRDVNSGGNEAAGLVQVIPSTFAAYRDKALPNDRFNPLASLTAGMNYAKARYGASGLLNVIGKGHGYAQGGQVAPSAAFARSFNQLTPTLYDAGGLLQKGVQLIDHRRNTPDYVLTDRQWDAMYTLAEKSAGNTGVNIGAVYGADGDEVAREILKLQRQQEMLAL